MRGWSDVTSSHKLFAELTGAEQAERDLYSNPRPQIRFMTKNMEVWSPCGDYREFKFTDIDNTPGGLTVLVPDDDHWGEYFYGQPRDTMRPIVVDLPGWRTFWLTVSFSRVRQGRRRFIEVSAVHCIEYLNWMRIWPDPHLPPEWQPSKNRMRLGPAATVCAAIMIPELQRLQGGLWPIMTHARFYRSTDHTAWTSGVYRMDKAYDAVKEICDAEDLQIVPTLYIHGEDEQPFPQWHVLDRTTLIIDFVPRINDRAITGTVVDGLLRTGLEVAEGFIEWIMFPILDPSSPQAIDELTGRDGEVFPVYRSGQWSPVDELSQTTHIQMATRITAGGHSPDWMNDIILGGLEAIVRGIAGIFNLDGFIPDFIKEWFTDTVLAFHSLEDRRASDVGGPWRFREAFADAQASGLSLQIAQAMKSAAFAHRGYTSHSIVVENGSPYLVGRHIKVGWPVGVEMPDGTVEVDRVTEISYEDSRSAKGRIVLQVGSGEAEQEPGIRGLNRLRRFGAHLHRVSLGG